MEMTSALQLFTLFFYAGFLIFACKNGIGERENKTVGSNDTKYKLISRKIGDGKYDFLYYLQRLCGGKSSHAIPLLVGSYVLSSGLFNDIYVQGMNENKLLLNVTAEKLYLTVLKGKVVIEGHEYKKNQSKQLEIQSYQKIKAGNVILSIE